MERVEEEFVEIDLREYINVLLKHKNMIVGIFLISILISGVVSYFVLDPVYQSEALIKLGSSSGDYSNSQIAPSILTSLGYLKQVNQELDLEFTLSELTKLKEEQLQVKMIDETKDLIKITYNSKSARESKAVINRLIKQYQSDGLIEFEQNQKLKEEKLATVKAEIKNLETRTKEIESKLNDLTGTALSTADKVVLNNDLTGKLQAMNKLKISLRDQKYQLMNELNDMERIQVINEPIKPEEPIKPNKKLNIVIAAVLGLMIGVFVAFFMEFLEEEEEVVVNS
ncbi:hypothetical protein JCM16358_12910 [Halanaerocella petrolearia]